jgi:hypothetical protein
MQAKSADTSSSDRLLLDIEILLSLIGKPLMFGSGSCGYRLLPSLREMRLLVSPAPQRAVR